MVLLIQRRQLVHMYPELGMSGAAFHRFMGWQKTAMRPMIPVECFAGDDARKLTVLLARCGICIPIASVRQIATFHQIPLILFDTDMKYFKKKTALGVCTLLATALTACGGGSGGGSSSSSSSSSSTSGTDISTLATATYNYTTIGVDATAYPVGSSGSVSVLTTGTGAKLNLDSVNYNYVSSSKSFTNISATSSSTMRNAASSSLPAGVLVCKDTSNTLTHVAIAQSGVATLTNLTNFVGQTWGSVQSCNKDSSGNAVTDGTWTFNSDGTVTNTYTGGSTTLTVQNVTDAISSAGLQVANDGSGGTKTLRFYPMSYTNGGTTKYFLVMHMIKTGSYNTPSTPTFLAAVAPSDL